MMCLDANDLLLRRWLSSGMLRRVVWYIFTDVSEARSFSETSVSISQTTRCNIPEDSHLHTGCRENLKSHRSSVTRTLLDVSLVDRFRHTILFRRPAHDNFSRGMPITIDKCVATLTVYSISNYSWRPKATSGLSFRMRLANRGFSFCVGTATFVPLSLVTCLAVFIVKK
jgi:hypothetical protein